MGTEHKKHKRHKKVISFLCLLCFLCSVPKAVFGQTQPPTRGPAESGSPAWFLQGSFPDPGGNTIVDANGHVTIPPRTTNASPPATSALPRTPGCNHSPVCGNRL